MIANHRRDMVNQLFDRLLLEVIDQSLALVLGENSRSEIYCYLKETSDFDNENLSSNLNTFQSGIRKLMGSSTTIIENTILKELYNRIGLEYNKDKVFIESIKFARNYFLNNKRSIDRFVKKSFIS